MVTIEKLKLKSLKKKFDDRQFAIPQIQRQYVWKNAQVLKLLDSIFKNYPIGIGLIWKAPFTKALEIRPNNKSIIPPFNRNAKTVELVIDGQQRLSTLYGLLNGIEERPDAGSTINFRNIFFDCKKSASKKFVISNRYDESTKGYIRLFDLINSSSEIKRKKLSQTQTYFLEAQKCYEAFQKYDFFILQYSGKNFNDIREIFIRVNTAGMRVSRADALFAKATDVKLRDHIIEAKRRLSHDYDYLSTDVLLNSLSLVYDAKTISAREMEIVLNVIDNKANGKLEFNKKWKRIQRGYETAVDFLVNNMQVNHPFALPYENMFALLSYFFYLNQSRASLQQIREIKKWFWHTACGERYSGASFNINIPADIIFFKKLAKIKNVKYTVDDFISPLDVLKADYRKASSIAKAYFLLLRVKKPAYLNNGTEMQLEKTSSSANRKDRHHIFPKALLRRHKVNSKWVNSVTNICYLEADENKKVSDSHPRIYLPEYKKYKHFGRVMKNSMIPVSTTSPVWDNNSKSTFINFLNVRAKLILAEFEKIAGTKLFEKFDNIKRI